MNQNTTIKTTHTNWKKLEQLQDEEIDTSDIPALDAQFFQQAHWKTPVTINIETDILIWLKNHNIDYQTQINNLLRDYMQQKNVSI
jgi:uncharacterized protein (DUF4415 family)